MMQDLPMTEEYNADSEMMIDYDAYDYEMQDDALPAPEPIQEFDMEGDNQADYGDPIAAEPEGMLAEDVPSVDVPIVEEPVATAPVDIQIVTEAISPPTSSHPATLPVPLPPPTLPLTTVADPLPTILNPSVAPLPFSTLGTQPREASPQPPEPIVIPDALLTSTSTPAPVVEPEEAPAKDVPAVVDDVHPSSGRERSPNNEVAALLAEASPETIAPVTLEITTPTITLYFDEQPFPLFSAWATRENEQRPIVLLDGRAEFFTAPLTELLGALKTQEDERFSGLTDCVLGLEYQELDLCIDENSKYASSYTLKDLCDALMACNHRTIDLTLYQITDFEYSLQQRLKGIVPEYVVVAEQAHEDSTANVTSTADDQYDPATVSQAPQSDAASEVDDAVADIPTSQAPPQGHPQVPEDTSAETALHPDQDALSPHPADDTLPSNDYSVPTTVSVTDVESGVPPSTSIAAVEEPEDSEEYEDAEEGQHFEDAAEPETNGNQGDGNTTTTDGVNVDGAELAQNPAGNADDESNSSGTLDSSTHGEVESHVGDPRAAAAAVEQAHAQAEEEIDEFESDFEEDGPDRSNDFAEPTEDQIGIFTVLNEVDEPAQADDGEAELDQLDQDGLDSPQIVREASEATEAHEVPAQNSPPSPLTTSDAVGNEDFDEYGDYELDGDLNDELDASADGEADNDLPSETLPADPAADAKTPPAVARVFSGKRDREEDDLSEYDVDEDAHESDSKRPRVE